MINIEKLFIKDINGNLFKICLLKNLTDKHGEPYLKICLPKKIKEGRLYDINKSSRVLDNYYEQFKYEKKFLSDFTYHYISGVSHFKFKNDHILQLKKLPRIKNDTIKPFLLLKIDIFDLPEPHIKKISKNDFIIQTPFNNKRGRILHVYLNNSDDSIIYDKKNDGDSSLVNYIDSYEFIDTVNKVKLTIMDHEYKNKPNNHGIAFHRPLDPKIKSYIKINASNFKQEFSFIQTLFINNDPGGLIDGGAPNDEYDRHIYQFISAFKSFKTEDDAYNYLKNLYTNFGGFDKNNGKIIAKKIWERYFDL